MAVAAVEQPLVAGQSGVTETKNTLETQQSGRLVSNERLRKTRHLFWIWKSAKSLPYRRNRRRVCILGKVANYSAAWI